MNLHKDNPQNGNILKGKLYRILGNRTLWDNLLISCNRISQVNHHSLVLFLQAATVENSLVFQIIHQDQVGWIYGNNSCFEELEENEE